MFYCNDNVVLSAFGQKESEHYLDCDLSSATESLKWKPGETPTTTTSPEVIDVEVTQDFA